jgi:hypothetical protein
VRESESESERERERERVCVCERTTGSRIARQGRGSTSEQSVEACPRERAREKSVDQPIR